MSFRVELRDVSFSHGKNIVLDRVNLVAEPGGIVIFGGRSGQGKSTLLEICAGLKIPKQGAVLWNDSNIVPMSRYELYDRRKAIGYVFQVHALISNHSVIDNIALPLKCGTNLSGKDIKDKVEAQMDELGIGRDIEKKFPEALSVAQLKSVAIARALINEPRLLLLDEPFSGVDPYTVDKIMSVLYSRWQKDKMSVIMATHAISGWPERNAGRFMLKDGRLEPASEAFATVHENLKYRRKYNHAE